MQYTRLGRSGLQVSRLALGMMTYGTSQWRPWILEEDAGRPLVRRAVELGFNFFDTADTYSAGQSEVLTGKFVREFCRRDEVVIATKVFFPVDLEFKGGYAGSAKPDQPNTSGLGRKRIFQAIDASLQRLGTDHVDLYQIHRWDLRTPIEETMEALHDVVKSGKARYIGASSMWAWQFAKAQAVAREHGWTPFASMQNHYNLVYREEEREMIPLCRDQGVGIVPWSPLARGFLAGNRAKDDKAHGATRRAETDEYAQQLYYRDSDFRVVQALTQIAGELDISAATLAYAWLLHKPGVTAPIIGASKPGQLEAAVAALDVSLKPEQIAALEAAYEPHPVLGHQ
jgi:aryl-alcohol dehydrogenase-like predicted oxidoreductase